MEKKWFLLHILSLTILSLSYFSSSVWAFRPCGNCGRTPVPYPLSTEPDCGDPWYKMRCTAGTLWLDALNGSSYPIMSIDTLTQRIVIRPAGLSGSNTCISEDFESQGIHLDENHPFKITGSNTVFLLNCTDTILNLRAPINCSATRVCHDYIKDNAVACKTTSLCCTFRTGGSQNPYFVGVHGGGCTAYQSFVNFDQTAALKKWPSPGLELEWVLPLEPTCKRPMDCTELLNSKCLVNPFSVGQMRCFCNAGSRWDPINGLCQKMQCKHGSKGCKIRKKKTKLIGVMAMAVSAGLALLLILIIGILLYKKHHRSNLQRQAQKSLIKEREQILNSKSSGKSTRIFTGKEITKATNNFSKANLIGSGGFGEVFKAVFDDGITTAIKRAKLGNTKGMDQILNEVRILCQVNHKSLVRLLGCCVELEQPLLIYEYIPNGTLFDHLHRHHSSNRAPLSWIHRLRIAHQTAEGLAYLHSSAVPPIYHRDIKSSNILLDEKLDAKVSDFGLSRLVEKTETNNSHIFTCAQGTLGYLDPDYYRNFQLTDKSDVYSFGVVLLELLTSMKAIDFNREEEDVNLAVYMKKIIMEERLMEAVDPVLKGRSSKLEMETMKALGSLAASCLDDQRQNRPSMKEVAHEIEHIISIATTS
ncbi:wall-associated receptor kinase-like 20 [Ziziphus jujuba]|uniref:Wall-associated receptor kinase-like 20 n=1 Tax=Ziziphus jujuba TaxID=326968 RepID=A0ABM3I2Y6_ZIZJJ|nr:wall-associated receptor kinase-like 20 [Ziziphus jujuba]